MHSRGIRGGRLLSLVVLLAILASTQLTISLVNWISTLLVKPRTLPRMDFSTGIPPEFRTLVIVPTLLTAKGYIDELMEELEIRFLANKGDNGHFGLLTDLVDGIDPYTRVSSDVYQDLFEEGSFIGKGIYDVDTFERTFRDLFQENRIISHDLLEGCYVRSGLVSDVFLYEEHPSRYESDLRRHHRWIRGDWQIAGWIFPFVRTGKGQLIKNRLSALSRWKIADNRRRSFTSKSAPMPGAYKKSPGEPGAFKFDLINYQYLF